MKKIEKRYEMRDAMDACLAASCEMTTETHRLGTFAIVSAKFDGHVIATCAAGIDGTIGAPGFKHFSDDLADPKTWESCGLTMPARERV